MPWKVQGWKERADILGQQLELVQVWARHNGMDTVDIHMGNWAVPWHRKGAVAAARVRVIAAPW